MRSIITVLVAIGFSIGSIFALALGSYALGYVLDRYLFDGAARLGNIITLMLVFVMIIATLLTLAERKWSALMQDRVGPNRARINLPGLKNRALAGIPHIATDVLKMLTKEDFMPRSANRLLFNLGPILAFAPAFALFAVVPAGPTIEVALIDLVKYVPMSVSNPDFGILYVFAIASLAVYGTSLAGWSSNNKFALLGGVRAASQMISYEVALGLSLVGIMMCFSTVDMNVMTDAQSAYLWSIPGTDLGIPRWGFLLQPLAFVAFFAASFAETKRAPFDVPEGESEIIGYFVEYSGMKFGLFMISEFVEVVVLAAVSTAVFFGGYHLPFGNAWFAGLLRESHPLIWGAALSTVFWIKVLLLIWVQLAIRWTFPRFRYDQIQTLGWKILLPLGIANVFITGALILWDPSLRALAIFGLLQIGVVVALALVPNSGEEKEHGAHGHHGAHGATDVHAAPHTTAASATH